MPITVLDDARTFLVNSLKGKHSRIETMHPWRKDWEFGVLHSLRVESYALKILAREDHSLSDHEIILLRLVAILHDIAGFDQRENHAELGAEIVKAWLHDHPSHDLKRVDIETVLEMIADHSNKGIREENYSKAVLKDADTLDEIGAMSIFMTSNWVDPGSPFFFYELRQRLIDFEIPYCDKKLSILNTAGAKDILREKKVFMENFIAQLTDELEADAHIVQKLSGSSL
jgi:HD superfamily phosphodiesterase